MSRGDVVEAVQKVQRTGRIRNVCIIAHVDHGKSTISDYLISTNGVISKRMAGKLRYLDSRPDEQERCITMKTSSIALLYQPTKPKDALPIVVNMIDSPGHIDFSSEVSAAVRVSDGAVLVVDAVDGLGSQTETVLRQAWKEGLGIILVINKMDRLIVDLKYTPMEAYIHLRNILERINAFTSRFHLAEALHDKNSTSTVHVDDNEALFFSPEKGNVIFASAIDCWGFSIASASKYFASKLGMKSKVLQKYMWGDFYYNPKTKSISKKPPSSSIVAQPIFVDFILEKLWDVYSSVLLEEHRQKTDHLVQELGIQVSAREFNTTDYNVKMQCILSAWMPISDVVLGMIEKRLPSPQEAQPLRLERIWPQILADTVPAHIRDALVQSDPNAKAPCFIYVTKVVAVNGKLLQTQALPSTLVRKAYVKGKFTEGPSTGVEDEPQSDPSPQQQFEDRDYFVAFSRILSGTLRKGQELWCVGPRHDVAHIEAGKLSIVYLQGRDVEHVEEAYAGSVVGLLGVDDAVLSTATLSSLPIPASLSPETAALEPMTKHSSPIIKVAIRPAKPSLDQMEKLSHGLQLLSKADPNVDVYVEDSGSQVIVACGEVHLERCLRDLKDQFAPDVPLRVSDPTVAFRETLLKRKVPEPTLYSTSNNCFAFSLQFLPLPFTIINFIARNESLIRRLGMEQVSEADQEALQHCFRSCGAPWNTLPLERLWSFGPHKVGPNMLLNMLEDQGYVAATSLIPSTTPPNTFFSSIAKSFVSAFQGIAKSGPICAEPLHGVAVLLHHFEQTQTVSDVDSYGPLSGQLISAMKSACAQELAKYPLRLMEAMFEVKMQCSADVLGRLCSLLEQRRGRVVQDEMDPATSLFELDAHLPIAESFGFTREIRVKTRGAAYPQLMFSHWETIEVDPFWVPTTEEELEEFGNEHDAPNLARDLMNAIRRRKGLSVKEHVVENAEKQRTLKH